MVMTRRSSIQYHPPMKQILIPPQTKLMSRRIPELPSLRYGTLGAKCTVSGPLRVSNRYHSDTLPRANSKKARNSYREDASSCKPSRPPRRVRFTLPSSDGDTGRSDVERTFSADPPVKRTAGVDGCPKTRVTPISARSDIKVAESSVRYIGIRIDRISLQRRNSGSIGSGLHLRHQNQQDQADIEGVFVPVTASPAVRTRIHPTGRYIRGTLSPTANTAAHAAPTPGGQLLLRAARDGEDGLLRDLLRRAQLVGISDTDLNATDNSGRTALSYIASNGSVETLDQILQLPNLDPNIPDNEGNTPLHFAAQAGQVECLNCMLTRCRGIEIDARNNLGFTPLMKAALQGRNKCAKILLFADEQKVPKISLWKQWKNYLKGRRKEDSPK